VVIAVVHGRRLFIDLRHFR